MRIFKNFETYRNEENQPLWITIGDSGFLFFSQINKKSTFSQKNMPSHSHFLKMKTDISNREILLVGKYVISSSRIHKKRQETV
jgi:hypothetical protein